MRVGTVSYGANAVVTMTPQLGTEKYVMSFTAGALLHRESIVAAELYRDLDDWAAVRGTIIGENRLQMRTLSASKRIAREVVSRLELLSPAQFTALLDSPRQDQNHLLWLAICKRYRFIREFAVEVLREKYLRLDLELTYGEYDAFFYSRAEWYPEVERVAESTRVKQREVVFRMLREAGLLSAGKQIIPAMPGSRVINVIALDSPTLLAILPASDMEIKDWLP